MQRTKAKTAKGIVRNSKGAARHERILSDLMAALADGSLRNPSLREIGQALEIEPAHILYYFPSREALLQAVINRWDMDSRSFVGKADSGLPITLDDFVAAIAHNITQPGIVHLYLTLAAEAINPGHAAHGFFRERFAIGCNMLADAIRREQADGSIAPDQDPDLHARFLIALADGLQLQSLVDPDVDAAGDLGDAVSLLRRLR